jgi:hypothetical protein
MYTFKIKNKDGKVQEYEHIKKVYYGHKGISEHTLEGDEIFNTLRDMIYIYILRIMHLPSLGQKFQL